MVCCNPADRPTRGIKTSLSGSGEIQEALADLAMNILDQRQIHFSPDALVAAIAASPAAAAALGLPPLKPQSVRLLADAGKVDVVFQTSGGARSVGVALVPLAALLLAFCFRAKIPLPRKARKAARIEGDAVVLDLSLTLEPDFAALKPEGAMQNGGGAKSLDWGSGSPRAA